MLSDGQDNTKATAAAGDRRDQGLQGQGRRRLARAGRRRRRKPLADMADAGSGTVISADADRAHRRLHQRGRRSGPPGPGDGHGPGETQSDRRQRRRSPSTPASQTHTAVGVRRRCSPRPSLAGDPVASTGRRPRRASRCPGSVDVRRPRRDRARRDRPGRRPRRSPEAADKRVPLDEQLQMYGATASSARIARAKIKQAASRRRSATRPGRPRRRRSPTNANFEARIATRLEAAGMALKSSEWLLLHIGIAFAAGILGLLISGGNPLVTRAAPRRRRRGAVDLPRRQAVATAQGVRLPAWPTPCS